MSAYSLGQPASDFYETKRKDRTGPVDVARRLADIILPSRFPEETWNSGDELPVTNQSISARCINTLSTKLTSTALPPNLPNATFNPNETSLKDDIDRDPELWAQVQYALSRREEIHRKRLGQTLGRTAYGKVMTLLLLTGNALTLWTDINRPRVYTMHQYVTVRDNDGEALVTVLKDPIVWATADEDIKAAATNHRLANNVGAPEDEWDETIDIFHVQKMVKEGGKKRWLYWQEVEGGHVIADTDTDADYETPTMYPAVINLEAGSHYGLPYALDYEGDHQSVENFSSALQDGAAAAAWFLIMVNPTGTTKIKDVQEADNLSVIPGRAEDITAPIFSKSGDLQIADKQLADAARRLGFAYAMNTAIQRPGERVTREEWVVMSRELNEAMGGLYVDLSQSFQLWFIRRFIFLHIREAGSGLKELPEGLVSIGVVTGLDSIGQTSEHQNLIDWAKEGQEVLTPQGFMQELVPGNFLKRSAALRSVKIDGLIKSADTKAAEQQQAQQAQMQQTVLDKATGPLVKEGGAMIQGLMAQQQAAGAQGVTNGG